MPVGMMIVPMRKDLMKWAETFTGFSEEQNVSGGYSH